MRLENNDNKILVQLVTILYDIVPHAVAPERTISIFGWLHNKKRNKLNIEKTSMMAAIHLSHSNTIKQNNQLQYILFIKN